ncbi:small proline-rich protein 2B-like [Solenopsis invicta]|uniref:small proline-rich protein 2B-like n=1 Tax=Solenopsis invicta TaxID=13686 RepID=UPI000E33F821|nr:small proline-rich protein 2B-like [Solenopsis invicta]
MSSCQNLCFPPSPCLPTRCPIPCSVICCTPPVSYPSIPRAPRVEYKIACPPPIPKPTKTVVYLPPCPTCMSSPPKMEMTYLPPTPCPPPCLYVCNTNCVPCPPPVLCNSPCKPQLCLPCPPC